MIKEVFILKDNSILQSRIAERNKESRVDEFAYFMSDFINGANSSEIKGVASKMANSHPTLQQGFMKLFMDFVESMSESNKVDNRNIDSVALAIEIMREIPESDRTLREI